MPLFKLVVAYDGSRFNGFQRQITNEAMNKRKKAPKRPHWDSVTGKRKQCAAVTIQDVLEDALCQLSGCTVAEICLKFAARTDKGVHARGQVVVVNLPSVCDHSSNLWEMRKSVNSRLPVDVSVEHVESLTDSSNFEPRHHVKEKVYSYSIKYRRKVYDAAGQLLPICQSGPHAIRSAHDPSSLWVCPWALDDTVLDVLASHLTGEHDWSVFVHKDDRDKRNHVLTVNRFQVETLSESNEEAPVVTVRFIVAAKGFRRTMIRKMVGFCVDVCRGEIADDVDWDVLWCGNERIAAQISAAPACGLCLESVTYD